MNHNFGDRPQVYSAIDCRAYVREITLGGLETIHKVGNYLRIELYVCMSDSTMKRVLQKEKETKAYTSLD